MTTNYVSPTGSATWAASENSSTPCSMATANANADDDDILVLAGGTYSTGIVPTYSGSDGHPITYTVASGATVNITAARGIDLRNGQDYITIQKGDGAALNLNGNSYRAIDAGDNVSGGGADYLIIDGVTQLNTPASSDGKQATFAKCDYLTLKNSFFEWTYTGDKYSDGVTFFACKHLDIGPNNEFGDGTHASFTIRRDCQYVRVHNNTHNNRWRHGLNVGDNTTTVGEAGNIPQDILIENNYFDRNGILTNSNPYSADCRGRSAAGVELTNRTTIVRNNVFFKCDLSCLFFAGDRLLELRYNHIYHNTIYQPQDYGSLELAEAGIGLYSYYHNFNYNFFINNIIADPLGGYAMNISPRTGAVGAIGNKFQNNVIYTPSVPWRVRYITTNYYGVSTLQAAAPTVWSGNLNSNPLLNSPDSGNFSLLEGSSANSSAAFLATVASKNDNTLTLGTNEAYAFAPYSWDIPNFNGDTVYNQDGDSATVTARPAHNQITLDDATDFEAGDTLTVVAFTGAAPNIGAVQDTIDDPVVTGDTEYVGWTTSSGTPATDPTSDIDMADDRTYLRKWTATEPGTVYSMRFFVESSWSANAAWAVVYKMVAGIALQLIAVAELDEVMTTNDWTDEILLHAPEGRSAAFITDDDLYYGVSADPVTAYSTSVGREETGGSGLYYSIFPLADGVLLDIGVDYLSSSSSRDMAFVLGYSPPAVDADGPVVTIQTPEDIPHTATGVGAIALAGVASDPSGINFVLWETDHGSAGTASGDRTWSIPSVPIAAGPTVITVTAADGLGNEDDATLTVNFASPAGSEVIGWEDSDTVDNPPAESPASRTFTEDRTYLMVPEAMTEAGDIVGVYFFVPTGWDPIAQWVVVYKISGDNTVLVAQQQVRAVAYDAWNYLPITVAESGQLLSFVSGDYLAAGIACDVDATHPGGWGRNETGGSGLRYSTQAISGAPIASFVTANMLTLTGYHPGFSLVVVPVSADTTLPELEITSHPDVFDAGTTATITLKGRASDPAGIASVTWTTDLGGSGTATGTTDWTIEAAALVVGTTVFTIVVTDGAGNETSRTVSVTRYASSDLRLPAIYDGNTYSPAISYSSLTSPGSWEWIQYAFKLTDIIDQVLLWSPNDMLMVVALSMDGTSWDYYGGNEENALEPDSANYPRLVQLDSWEDRHTRYVRMTGGGCYSMPLKNGTVAQYARVHFWVPVSPTEVVINELRVERQVVAEQIRALSLGAISADIGTVSAGILHSQTLTASAGVLMDLNTGIIYVGGSTSRKIELNGPTGTVYAREGGKIVVGLDNITIDSTDLGGSQGRIEVAPNGGKAGQDYVLVDSGNIYKMVYLAGAHRKYSYLSRSESPIEVTSVPQTGVTVQVPGYWRKLPKITAQSSNFISYNASYPDQTQRVICRAENTRWRTTAAAGQVDFTARAHSEICAASVFGAGAVSGAVNRTPTTTSDFPAQTISVASVNANCQRVELSYAHAACSGFVWYGTNGTSIVMRRSYAVQRTLTCQIYYSGAWHTIASDTYNEYTDWNDRIVRSVNSGWVGAAISAYRVVMSAGVVSQTTWQGEDDIQYLNFTSRVEYLSNTLGAIAGSMVYVAVE